MKPLLLACFLAAAAGPALAVMAPQYYEQARNEAPEVVIIEVASVKPPSGRDFGECLVRGRINRVERGRRRVGEHLELSVSCAGPRAQIPSGGTLWQDLERLKHSRYGRAFLGADGGVISYDML